MKHILANKDCEFCQGTGYDEPSPAHPDDPIQPTRCFCTCVVEAMERQERAERRDERQQDLIRDLRDVDAEIAQTTKRIAGDYDWLRKQMVRRVEMMAELKATTE